MTQPYSRHRLLQFSLAELPRDINNQVDGPGYETFLRLGALRSKKSLVGETHGVWSGSTYTTASLQEREVLLSLEGNARIISIRTGYVFQDAGVVQDLIDDEEVSRNRVMTVDFVLTLAPERFGGPLRYMGLSSKPQSLRGHGNVARRAEREQAKLQEIGWGWAYATLPSKTNVANHVKLRSWAKNYPLDDAAEDAPALAALLYLTSSRKNLRALLTMLAKRIGISERDQYFVFAAAYYFGYLCIDHAHLLDEERPLVLAPPVRTASRGYSYVQR